MSCNIETLEGSKISIGTGVTVADCDTKLAFADYDGVSDWTAIGAVETFTLDGDEWTIIDNKLLSGAIAKGKGTDQTGKATIEIVYQDGDAGQAVVKTARDSKENYAFKFEYSNGKIAYAQGLVTRLSMPQGNGEELYKRQILVELTQKVVSNL